MAEAHLGHRLRAVDQVSEGETAWWCRRVARSNRFWLLLPLRRTVHFPVGWDPFFTETMTLVDVYHFGTQHFDYHQAQLPHVQHLLTVLGIQADIQLVNVSDEADAQRLKFLGSPSLRVNGHDVDPTAHTRNHYALQCRLYRTEAGLAGTPSDEWVKRALVQPGP